MNPICFECETEIVDPDDVFCRQCYTDLSDSTEAWTEHYGKERLALQAQLATTQQQRDELLSLVEAVEWVEGWPIHQHVCSWCDGKSHEGHFPDCPRQSILARVRGPKPDA